MNVVIGILVAWSVAVTFNASVTADKIEHLEYRIENIELQPVSKCTHAGRSR